jgi:hypothetical protein
MGPSNRRVSYSQATPRLVTRGGGDYTADDPEAYPNGVFVFDLGAVVGADPGLQLAA